MPKNIDLAGKDFWESQWAEVSNIRPIDVTDQSVRNYQRRRYHQLFSNIFSALTAKETRLLELGCASSFWLPYFAKEFGFKVAGIDYSESGCALERRLFSALNISGEVINADFFAPPEECLEKYDALISFGVAEHFTDTSGCLRAFSRFLKPGGIIFTLIPNMLGVPGMLAKTMNRPFYDLHMIISAESLAEGHRQAGFINVQSEYFTSVNFGVLNNFNGIEKGSAKWVLNKSVVPFLQAITVFTWFLECTFIEFKASKTFSPYVICTGIKE